MSLKEQCLFLQPALSIAPVALMYAELGLVRNFRKNTGPQVLRDCRMAQNMNLFSHPCLFRHWPVEACACEWCLIRQNSD